MDLALAILGWSLFGLAIFVGIMLDIVGLFGNWVILAAVTIAFAVSGFAYFAWWTIAILFVLAVVGEVAEMAAAGYGAAKFGGSKGAMVAAMAGCLVGAVLGTPVFPVVGTILGAAAGAFIAAMVYEMIQHGKGIDDATRVGFGAALGKVAGLFAKTFVGFAMLLIAALTF